MKKWLLSLACLAVAAAVGVPAYSYYNWQQEYAAQMERSQRLRQIQADASACRNQTMGNLWSAENITACN